MATTAIAPATLSTGFSTTGDAITWTAADVGNGNHFAWPSGGGKVILLARNVHAVTAYTVSITSIADPNTGRTGHVAAQSIAAGAVRSFPLNVVGWNNTTTGQVAYSANNASIEFAVLVTAH